GAIGTGARRPRRARRRRRWLRPGRSTPEREGEYRESLGRARHRPESYRLDAGAERRSLPRSTSAKEDIMADSNAAVMIRWGNPIPGREGKSLEVFMEALGWFG